MRMWLKECPRCGGDLREESNAFGRYVPCMQCGHIMTHTQEARLMTMGSVKELSAEERLARAAEAARKAGSE